MMTKLEGPVAVDDLFPHGQIRLRELSVYNWGSFHGLHSAALDPHGTLITGDNGAGKSTLIDAVIALLLPLGRATFNVAAAQGDRTDRSIVSYIRGSFGNERDGLRTKVQSKREGAVISALRASYGAEDGSQFTLATLLWIPNASHAITDLKRLYLATRRNLTLEELLEVFRQGQARAVNQRYRGEVFDTFSEYEETYKRMLCIQNPNAPALLARALGLKKIDDLTTLIREFVLEPTSVRDAARKAVAEFADLVATHNELLDARRQRDVLEPLPTIQEELEQARREHSYLEEEKVALPVYFAEHADRLWAARALRIGQRLAEIELHLEQLGRAEADATTASEARHAEYLQAGGSRIEDLRKELAHAQSRLQDTAEAAAAYQKATRSLGLDDRLIESSYHSNRARAQIEAEKLGERKLEAQDRFADAGSAFSASHQLLNQLNAQLTDVEARPDSAIDSAFSKLREEIGESLGFAEHELMFIGELIDVKEEERAWQGAIERALGGLRLTLAIPEDRYRLVTRWLNARHLGLHMRAQVVRDIRVPARFKDEGFLRKLEWRAHPYREWLKQHLARFDLACVPDPEALNATPFSMTQSGLIHRESGRFEKHDRKHIDDRSEWYLGFSNARRLALLRRQVSEQEAEVARTKAELTRTRAALGSVDEQALIWKELQTVRWDRIDLPRARGLHSQAEQNLHALERVSTDLVQAKERWEAAKKAVIAIQQERDEKLKQQGATNREFNQAEANARNARAEAKAGVENAVRERLSARIGSAFEDEHLEQLVTLEAEYRGKIEGALSDVDGRIRSAGSKAIGIMSAYRARDEWQAITSDWGSYLIDLPIYVERFRHIEREGLPNLVEQFRERLNRHATHSLAAVRSQINNELDDIRERIETINGVLARTEFRQGTHLRLRAESEEYEHVRDFNRQLQGVMQAAVGEDHEARFAALRGVVAILEKATSPTSAYTKESQRLLDPRYRLSFVAEDIDTASGQLLDVLASSSGKSGGEKEAFAGTVVAASLAYVLTPDGADHPIYCTVFLDEAFSNTAEAVSRRVLRVFRELHIHVNLVTPFKNLNLARESARSLLIAERDQKLHESRLCQITWEEIDKRLAQRAASRSELAAVDVKRQA